MDNLGASRQLCALQQQTEVCSAPSGVHETWGGGRVHFQELGWAISGDGAVPTSEEPITRSD